jgi:hypothetical protein
MERLARNKGVLSERSELGPNAIPNVVRFPLSFPCPETRSIWSDLSLTALPRSAADFDHIRDRGGLGPRHALPPLDPYIQHAVVVSSGAVLFNHEMNRLPLSDHTVLIRVG